MIMNEATIEEVMPRLQRRGFHSVFKGANIQVEVAQYLKQKGFKAELHQELDKPCDLIISELWLVDVATATLNGKDKYFFNNRVPRREDFAPLDFMYLIPVDMPRLPMWSLDMSSDIMLRSGFAFDRNMESMKYHPSFIGYLR